MRRSMIVRGVGMMRSFKEGEEREGRNMECVHCVCDVTSVWWERRRKGEEKGAGKICVKRNMKATARRKKEETNKKRTRHHI